MPSWAHGLFNSDFPISLRSWEIIGASGMDSPIPQLGLPRPNQDNHTNWYPRTYASWFWVTMKTKRKSIRLTECGGYTSTMHFDFPVKFLDQNLTQYNWRMNKNVDERGPACCQALSYNNQIFSFSLNISSDTSTFIQGSW